MMCDRLFRHGCVPIGERPRKVLGTCSQLLASFIPPIFLPISSRRTYLGTWYSADSCHVPSFLFFRNS